MKETPLKTHAKAAVTSFRDGMKSFLDGQRYVFSEHPELLKLCLFPMGIGLGIFVVLGGLFFSHVSDVLSWVWAKPEFWGWQILWYGFAAVAVALTGVTTVLMAYLGFMIVCAPFNDRLSERVEELEGTFSVRPFQWSFFFRDAWHSIVVELVKVFRKAVWLVPLYLLSLFFPVVGQLLYAVLGVYKMSFWLGVDYVDWALARRGYAAQERLEFAKQHRSALRGFGLMMTLFSMIPLGAVVCWPGAVAGGTLLCSGLSPADRRKESLGLPCPESVSGEAGEIRLRLK
ncbi:MAG: EI24 domain-containing protein [Deltaproteobacteria bacterium]|nr:EI24 domain-containing protein [Deltaproteobacteria bacterium]